MGIAGLSAAHDGFTRDAYSQMLGRIRFSGTARTQTHIDHHQNEWPSQYAKAHT
jgi:hypothetical protein